MLPLRDRPYSYPPIGVVADPHKGARCSPDIGGDGFRLTMVPIEDGEQVPKVA